MYLITGGAGFIGSALARALMHRGEDVRVIDNFSRSSPDRFRGHRIQVFPGDVCDPEFVGYMTAGVDTVIHMAAINGTANFYDYPWDVLRVGIVGTLNVLQAAGRAKVRRIQYFSSSEVYQQPETLPTPESERGIVPDFLNPRYSYGGSKIAGELLTINYCRTKGIGWQIIRPHNVYGPGMGDGHVVSNLAERIEAGKPLVIQGSGEETRTFCHIDDMVAGILMALDLGTWQDIYNVGSNEEVTIRDLAQRLAKAMGVTIGPIVPSAPAAGGTSRRCPDISKLAALGYRPRVPLNEGLRRYVAEAGLLAA